MSKLKNTFTLTTAAMLLALGIILGMLKIPINQFIEIRFGSLPISIGGAIFGPGVAAAIGAFQVKARRVGGGAAVQGDLRRVGGQLIPSRDENTAGFLVSIDGGAVPLSLPTGAPGVTIRE